MKLIVSGKNFDVTEALREKISKKLGKFDKYFSPGTEVHVTMSVERNRKIVEVTISFNGMFIRAEEVNDDMYTSIDKIINIIEKQISRNKTRLQKKLYDGAAFENNFNAGVEEEEEFRIVRSKKFAVKPMDTEEAILQMNLLGHAFFMFLNADTKEVNVVYRRKDGNYGLIEPEFE